MTRSIRRSALLSLAAACAVAGCSTGEMPQAQVPQQGATKGFVLTDFTFSLGGSGKDVCPDGLNPTERDYWLASLPRAQRVREEGMPVEDWLRKMRELGGPDPCMEPLAFEDPGHLSLDGPATVEGFDLDGHVTTAGASAARSCPHEDFTSPADQPGIDNQLWRVLACTKGYQPGSVIDDFADANIKSGSRTILLEISGIDHERNDDDVVVGVYSSREQMPTDATGAILPGASLEVTDDPQHRNVMRGRLVDGVLEAGPVDLRLDFKGQYLDSEAFFRSARIRLELLPDGSATGFLGGYWNIEGFFEAYGRQATRYGVLTVGYTCPGMYQALRKHADGFTDPQTGECAAISTTFRLSAVPAFVIKPDQVRQAEAAVLTAKN